MPTLKEVKFQMRKERQAKLQDELNEFQLKTFGKLLEVGDVIEVKSSKVINNFNDNGSTVEMTVYSIGIHRTSKNPAIGLIRQSKNKPDWTDHHNNYCLAYGKTRLVDAHFVRSGTIEVSDSGVGFNEIE